MHGTRRQRRQLKITLFSPRGHENYDLLALTLRPKSKEHITVSFLAYEFTIPCRASQEGKQVVDMAVDLFIIRLRKGTNTAAAGHGYAPLRNAAARLSLGAAEDITRLHMLELFDYDSWSQCTYHQANKEPWDVVMKQSIRTFLYSITFNFYMCSFKTEL